MERFTAFLGTRSDVLARDVVLDFQVDVRQRLGRGASNADLLLYAIHRARRADELEDERRAMRALVLKLYKHAMNRVDLTEPEHRLVQVAGGGAS